MQSLSLCHYTIFHVPPPQLIEIAHSIGFQNISLMLQFPAGDERSFPILGKTAMRRETRERLSNTGISLFDVSSCRLDAGVTLEAYRPMFETAAYLGAKKVSVSIFDPNQERFDTNFARLCEMLIEYGLGAGLEFMPLSTVKTVKEAKQLIERTKVTNAAITIDATHLARSGGCAFDVKALHPKLISYVQLCDGPAHLPSEKWAWEAGEERQMPGEGEFPLHELLDALPKDILIGIEAPSKRLRDRGVSAQAHAQLAFDSLNRLLSEHEKRQV